MRHKRLGQSPVCLFAYWRHKDKHDAIIPDSLDDVKPPNADTQNATILEHLLKGYSITPKEALHFYGSMRLGARIYDLRSRGYNIESELVVAGGRRFARYWMTPEEIERVKRGKGV